MQCDEKVLNRLKRAEGQMRGIQKMMAEEKDCADILVQLSAVRSSINRVMGIIVSENMRDCLENPALEANEQAQKIEQAMQMIKKL